MTGSSPHTWGTPPAGHPAPDPSRFIPTHVGNTLGMSQSRIIWTVHPHTRGEHERRLIRIMTLVGSSPHTWGAPRD